MKATEARRIRDEAGKKVVLDDVYEIINKAAENGDSSVFYYKKLSDAAMLRLKKDDGYKITDLTDRDGIMYEIDWS